MSSLRTRHRLVTFQHCGTGWRDCTPGVFASAHPLGTAGSSKGVSKVRATHRDGYAIDYQTTTWAALRNTAHYGVSSVLAAFYCVCWLTQIDSCLHCTRNLECLNPVTRLTSSACAASFTIGLRLSGVYPEYVCISCPLQACMLISLARPHPQADPPRSTLLRPKIRPVSGIKHRAKTALTSYNDIPTRANCATGITACTTGSLLSSGNVGYRV